MSTLTSVQDFSEYKRNNSLLAIAAGSACDQVLTVSIFTDGAFQRANKVLDAQHVNAMAQ